MQETQEIQGCSDHSCIFGHPGGMGTNGGCQCEKHLRELGHELRMQFVRNIKALRARCEAFECVVEESERVIAAVEAHRDLAVERARRAEAEPGDQGKNHGLRIAKLEETFPHKIAELERRIQAGLRASMALSDDYDTSTKYEIRRQIDCALRKCAIQQHGRQSQGGLVMSKEDTRKFCSSIESDCERAFGPFDTRQEAIDAAVEERDGYERPDTECVVGRCDYLDPGWAFNKADCESLLESMEDRAADNGYGHAGGEVFELRDPEGGMSAITSDIQDVLRKHLKSDQFFIMGGPIETVQLPDNSSSWMGRLRRYNCRNTKRASDV